MATQPARSGSTVRRRPRRQNIRHLVIFLSFLAFPVTINFLSPYLIIQASFEGVLAGSGLAFLGLFVSSIFLGRLFCGWLCPGGGLNDILTGVNSRRVTGRWLRRIKILIWVVWLASLAGGFISSGGLRQINPLYLTESGISVDEPLKFIIYYGVILIFLLISVLVGRRASCHAICWMAPFMMLGTKLGDRLGLPRLHIASSAAGCISCERCVRQCPMSIGVREKLGPELAKHSDCCLCGECVDICPKGCLKYRFGQVGQIGRPDSAGRRDQQD